MAQLIMFKEKKAFKGWIKTRDKTGWVRHFHLAFHHLLAVLGFLGAACCVRCSSRLGSFVGEIHLQHYALSQVSESLSDFHNLYGHKTITMGPDHRWGLRIALTPSLARAFSIKSQQHPWVIESDRQTDYEPIDWTYGYTWVQWQYKDRVHL